MPVPVVDVVATMASANAGPDRPVALGCLFASTRRLPGERCGDGSLRHKGRFPPEADVRSSAAW
jgi:hypothetical protein